MVSCWSRGIENEIKRKRAHDARALPKPRMRSHCIEEAGALGEKAFMTSPYTQDLPLSEDCMPTFCVFRVDMEQAKLAAICANK